MTGPLQVSDHAVVRWIERVYGVDIDRLRARILSDIRKGAAAAEHLRAESFTVRVDGNKYVVKRGVIVTILDANMDAKL